MGIAATGWRVILKEVPVGAYDTDVALIGIDETVSLLR
jgi:hypothetical protein